jgi:hypothetical protein
MQERRRAAAAFANAFGLMMVGLDLTIVSGAYHPR